MARKPLFAVLLVLLVAPPAHSQQWARKMFQDTRHDFGTVARGAKTEFRFVLKNIYLEDVHIAGVRSSCRCTRVRIEQPWLKTYEEGAVVATINTPSFRGHKPATITVTFDKPRFAQVQLQSDVYIRSDVELEPGGVELGTVEQGTVAQKKITVTRTGRSDWEIVDVKSSNPHVSGEVVPARRDRGRVAYELSVRLNGTAPAGYLRDHLILVTNDRRNREVPVLIEGIVQAPVMVSPASLFMGVVQPGEKVTKQLVVRAKQPFRITAVRCDDDCFQFDASTEREPKLLHLVPVTFIASQTPGKVQKQIRIETDLGEPSPEASAYAVISP